MEAGEWYIEVNGRKVGPFTLDQVRGLLDDGEIRDYHQVTSVLTGGQWISVQEALQDAIHSPPPSLPPSISASVSEPALFEGGARNDWNRDFNPPPRPEIAPSGVLDDHTDPALSLFDALQVQKVKRTTIRPLTAKSTGPKKPLFRVPNVAAKLAIVKQVKQVKIAVPITPRMFWTAVFAGLVLGAATFGMMRIFKHHAPPASGSFTPIAHEPNRPEPFSFHHEPPEPHPVSRPSFAPQRHRVIPPPPPPAHVAIPPHLNPQVDNGEQRPDQQDGGYPPQENSAYPPRDQVRDQNGENPQQGQEQQQQQRQGDQQQGGAPDQNGQNGQNPQDGTMPAPPGGANAPGQDQFQPVQVPAQPQDQQQGQ